VTDALDDLLTAVYRKDLPALARLIKAHPVDGTDADGRTPLMHAILADESDPTVVEFLLAQGAKSDLADKGEGWTALHFAARGQKVEVVRLLLRAGAAVDPVDVFGNTPLWRCIMNRPIESVVSTLVAAGANPSRKNIKNVSPLDLATRLGLTEMLKLLTAPTAGAG
jgi:ankyrin repeat protein